MKSNKFILEDISAFDSIMSSGDEAEEEFLEDGDGFLNMAESSLEKDEMPKLFPRTPQPRKRKVSIFDLVKALEKALDVKNRRITREDTAPVVEVPKHHREISLVIKDVYDQVKKYFLVQKKLTFTQLLPSDAKEDIVLTFIPLLHLRNQEKIDLHQEEHFGEIEIELLKEKAKKVAEA